MWKSVICVAALSLAFRAVSVAADEEIERGRATEFDLEPPASHVGNVDNVGNSHLCFNCVRTVKMTQGHEMIVTATVLGEKRTILFLIEDPAGVRLAVTASAIGRNETKIRQVSATGLYRITLMSDRIGGGVVTVRDPADDLTTKELAERIAAKRKEIAELEQQLKAAQLNEDLKAK